MRVLELFSGSGSQGQSFAHQGGEVVSLDLDVKTDALTKTDILEWDHTVFSVGNSDVVWASPCCAKCSCARKGAKAPINFILADALVQRCLAIIEYVQPRVWFIENPTTGMLRDRLLIEDLPLTDVDYCCFFWLGVWEKDPAVDQQRLHRQALLRSGAVSERGRKAAPSDGPAGPE